MLKDRPIVDLADLPSVLSVPEAARFLRIGRNLGYQLIIDGSLRAVRCGRHLRVPKGSIEAFLAGATEARRG